MKQLCVSKKCWNRALKCNTWITILKHNNNTSIHSMTCSHALLLFWKLLQVIFICITANLTAEAQRTVPLLRRCLQFKSALVKTQHQKDVWTVKMENKSLLTPQGFLEMGQLDFFWAASGFFFLFFLLLFSPPIMITMCEGWIWVRRQFIFVMDTRTGKLSAWILEGRKTDLINVILEPGGRTMAKRTGLLFPLLYFMAEFWLTSQQVLRIGKCYFFFLFSP